MLFNSVPTAVMAATVAVVLTGMGKDGADGAQAIARNGGYVIAQDEASAVVWGMPGAVVKAGAAHLVAPIPQIARALAEVQRTQTVPIPVIWGTP